MTTKNEDIIELLEIFHDQWIECEVSQATGSYDLCRQKRAELIETHKKIKAAYMAAGEAA